MSQLNPGTVLNRNCYKINRFIAQGGFGITYLAEEIGYFKKSGFEDDTYIPHRHPEKVVVKELYYNDYCVRDSSTGLLRISNSEKRVEFEKLVNKQLEEGKILRQLNHPGIVTTRDIFQENGTAYMVMDYIDGSDLEQIVHKNGKLDKKKALHYIFQVLSAVEYMHNKKVLHLDITPSNILVRKDTDEAVLIDFGASLTYTNDNKASNNTSKLITGMKRHFAPVEQADIDNLKEFDATFDTYAIGATLYYLLTGSLPPISSMVSTGKQKVNPPSELIGSGETDEYLDAIILKAMAPRFHDRFGDTETFINMLRAEQEYERRLNSIYQMANTGEYVLALEKIKETENEMVETNAIKKLKELCLLELEKKKNEALYNQFIKKGSEWFQRLEYDLAKNEFEKAALLFPDREEHQVYIIECEKREALLKTEKELKIKVNELLYQARQHIANDRLTEAEKQLQTLLELVPSHPDALMLLAQLDKDKKDESEALLNEASRLFNEEKYTEARTLYSKVRITLNANSIAAYHMQLLSKNEINTIAELKDKYREFSSRLVQLNIHNGNSEIELKTLKSEFQKAEQKRIGLKLPSLELASLADEISSLIGEVESDLYKISESTQLVVKESDTTSMMPNNALVITQKESEHLTTEHKSENAPQSFKKTVLYFFTGAALAIILGLMFIISLRSCSRSSNEVSNPLYDSTGFQLRKSDISSLEPVELSPTDLQRIKDFTVFPEDFKITDNDIQELHQKIVNAPSFQKNINEVVKFETLYAQKSQ